MAKSWYPVNRLFQLHRVRHLFHPSVPHQVYDMKKAPVPVVLNPASCIDHCHGCGNRCPVGAITYVGDDNRLDAAARRDPAG